MIYTTIHGSISSSKCPNSLKTSITTPKYKGKKADPNNLKKCRPITVVSSLAKILDKVLLQQLTSFVDTNKLLSNSQFTYQTNHSIEELMNIMLNYWYNITDANQKVCIIKLHLCSAYEIIDTSVLQVELKIYGNNRKISGIIFRLLTRQDQLH